MKLNVVQAPDAKLTCEAQSQLVTSYCFSPPKRSNMCNMCSSGLVFRMLKGVVKAKKRRAYRDAYKQHSRN